MQCEPQISEGIELSNEIFFKYSSHSVSESYQYCLLFVYYTYYRKLQCSVLHDVHMHAHRERKISMQLHNYNSSFAIFRDSEIFLVLFLWFHLFRFSIFTLCNFSCFFSCCSLKWWMNLFKILILYDWESSMGYLLCLCVLDRRNKIEESVCFTHTLITIHIKFAQIFFYCFYRCSFFNCNEFYTEIKRNNLSFSVKISNISRGLNLFQGTLKSRL